MEETIHNVADTAAWIAMYRAKETRRKDAVFKDPLAEKLAGEKGKKIVEETMHSNAMEFAMVVRTTAIDKLINSALSKGIDTVINLGAGLDTRPYRMNLPAELNWIEVDFEKMISYKNEMLKSDRPVCRLQRIAADLSLDKERKELFARLGAATKKALVITEGVIAYLTNEQAAQLSADIHSIPTFEFWIQDYSQGKRRENKQQRAVAKQLKNAPWKFSITNPVEFFKKDGWEPVENIYMLDEADRIGRKLPLVFPFNILMALFPKKIRDAANKTYGFIMYRRKN